MHANIGTHALLAQVLVEQCRELDIAIAVSPRGAANIAVMMQRQQAGKTGSLTTPRPGRWSRGSRTVQMGVVGMLGLEAYILYSCWLQCV